MACRYTYKGKTYEAFEFDDVLRAMKPAEAALYMPGVQSLPDAPFIGKTDAWLGLALKRTIRYAAENGFEKIAFITGDQSAERYDLSKQIESVTAYKETGGSYRVSATDKDGRTLPAQRAKDEGELEGIVGKELAQKIVAQKALIETYSGLDLKVGGEGMKAFYNQIVPKVAKDVLKKLGGQMGEVKLTGHADYKTLLHAGESTGLTQAELDRMPFPERKALVDSKLPPQPGFTITPSMRDTAMQGMPLFSRKQNPQTQTTEFKRWFGDSKVVAADGEPLVVYHGTSGNITAFDGSFAGSTMFSASGMDGLFFTADSDTAAAYAKAAQKNQHEKFGRFHTSQNIMPVYLSMRNPLVYERARRDSPTLLDALKRRIVAEAKEAGNDGVIFKGFRDTPTGRGTVADTFVAFLPEQIKSAIGNNGSFDPANPDIRFSRPQKDWDATEPGKMDDFVRTMQDKMVDVKRFIEAIKKAGIKIADQWNPYLQETLYHGRTAKRTKDFLEREMRPLLEEMRARKVKIEEFDKYLLARHAEEANVHLASLDPNNPKAQDGLSGMKTADAKAHLASLTPERKRTLDALAAKIDAINKGTTDLLVSSGLESRSTINAWNATYKHYVPLYREDVAEQRGMGTGSGFDVRGPASKRRLGSDKPVKDILSNIVMQRERTIVRAEKNRVAQATWGLAAQAPNPDFWVAVDPTNWQQWTGADLVALGIDQVFAKNIIEEPKVRTLDKSGRVMWRVNPLLRQMPNVYSMRVNGEDRFVIFNAKSERAMEAAAALKNLDADTLGRVLTLSAKVSRYFAAINTQWNPIFGLVNVTRDVQGAMLNLSTTPLRGKQGEVTKNILPALRGIYVDLREQRAGRRTNSVWANLFEEFQLEGGQTGFRDMFANSEERAADLQKALSGTSKAMALPKGVLNWLTDYNDAMENAVRLSAYKVAKDQGLSNQQAADIAKNLTVNFNRKGKVGMQAGALYAFFNASAQGTARLIETLKGPAGKKIVYGGLLLGSMQALLLAAAGFKDDEPPEFIRERNLIIPTGGGNYITIPMPLGLHVLPNLARIPTEYVLSGFKKPGERLASMISVFAEAFNPIGNAGLSIQTIAPTAVDPLVALSENKDFTGRPIAREDFGMKETPGHTRAKDTASSLGRAVSYAINLLSGGTEYKPGVLSPTPDQVDYLLGQVTGGVGREAMKINQTARATVTGEELAPYKIPVVGRFYGNVNGQAAQSSRFYESFKELQGHKLEVKGRQEDGLPVADYIRDNPEYRLVKEAEAVQRQVSKLRQAKRKLIERDAPPEQIRALEEQISGRMRAFNEKYESATSANP